MKTGSLVQNYWRSVDVPFLGTLPWQRDTNSQVLSSTPWGNFVQGSWMKSELRFFLSLLKSDHAPIQAFPGLTNFWCEGCTEGRGLSWQTSQECKHGVCKCCLVVVEKGWLLVMLFWEKSSLCPSLPSFSAFLLFKFCPQHICHSSVPSSHRMCTWMRTRTATHTVTWRLWSASEVCQLQQCPALQHRDPTLPLGPFFAISPPVPLVCSFPLGVGRAAHPGQSHVPAVFGPVPCHWQGSGLHPSQTLPVTWNKQKATWKSRAVGNLWHPWGGETTSECQHLFLCVTEEQNHRSKIPATFVRGFRWVKNPSWTMSPQLLTDLKQQSWTTSSLSPARQNICQPASENNLPSALHTRQKGL